MTQFQSQELLVVLHIGAEAQGLELSFTIFLGRKPGARTETEQPGHKLAPVWDDNIVGRRLACYAMALASKA